MPERPTVVVEKDYDGYFEHQINLWIDRKVESGKPFKHKEIGISAGPYRAAAVSYVSNVETGRIHFDFYSALRKGFGLLSEKDIEDIIELM